MAFSQNPAFPSASSSASNFSFGTSTTTAGKAGFGQPAFGTSTSGGFGTNPTTGTFGLSQPPPFGAQTSSGFGANTTGFGSAAPSTAFGSTAPNTGFGSTAPSTGFGSNVPSSGFGFGTSTLGATPASTAAPLFGGGLTSGGMFGSAPSNVQTTFQGFGGTTNFGAPSSTGLFSGTGLQQTSTGNTGFPSSFSFAPRVTQPTFGGFGGSSGLFGQLAQQQQPVNQLNLGFAPQQQQQQFAEQTDFVTANICGDDRDSTITNWNKLQARWGFGKGFLSAVMPPILYAQSNVYCCFKAVGYNILPTNKEEDGMVVISVVPKEPKQQPDPAHLQSALTQTLFAGKPQFMLVMHGIRANLETSHQYTISVTERQPTGQVRRLPATELATNLSNSRTQLMSLGIDNVVPLVTPPKEWIREYLASPPAGIDRKLWEQAIKDNPDPEKLIPTPMVGFADLRARMRSQEMESSKHLSFLQQAEQKVTELKRAVGETEVKLSQRRQALLTLQQRLLSLLVKLQVARRSGATLLPVEEELKTRLDSIRDKMSHPSHCKVKLGEIVSKTRLHKAGGSGSITGQYVIEPESLQDFQKFLSMEQEGISRLIDVTMTDQNCLKLIKQSLEELQIAKGNNKTFRFRQM